MQQDEVKAVFDKMAESYDQKWVRMAPVNAALHLLTAAALTGLPEQAKILCVGAGTGAELVYLAQQFPGWTFVAVDPSAAMLDVCRHKLSELGMQHRCQFHVGYLQSLSLPDRFDAATAILVSQFIQDNNSRTAFFQAIASSLKPGGMLISADLSAAAEPAVFSKLLTIWSQMMTAAGVTHEVLQQMSEGYARDVAILPEREIAAIIAAAGFDDPVCFYQAGLIHAWHTSLRITTDTGACQS